MRLPIVLFAAVAVWIAAAWAWLGAPVDMPPSPVGSDGKLYCVSYAPFRGAQNPLDASTHIPAAQIDEDLRQLSRITDCVRTYSIEHGLDQVPALAGKHGLKVMQGLWLSSNLLKNSQQTEGVIALANRYRDVVRSVVVGNEVLLRGEMAATDLVATIRRVKAAVPVPVTYADVWEFWLRNRDLYPAVDFVTVHILPYWEDLPIPAAEAAAHVDSIRSKVVAAFPDKEILIGETGWPSAGRMREGALPSPVNQALVMHEVLAAAQRGGYRVNLIEAYDQPWKRQLEGTVGGHWGLYDGGTRAAKFVWGGAVSDHPWWPLQAGAGVLMAAAAFAAAAWGARRRAAGPVTTAEWIMVALTAAIGGSLVGWTGEKVPLESLGIGGWLRSFTLAAVAAVAPVAAAAAMTRGLVVPRFAEVMGGEEGWPRDALGWVLGGCLIVLCVMATQAMLELTFDPRYKDFPFTALGAGAAPYLLLALRPYRRVKTSGTAERVAAALLLLCGLYVTFNEGLANWQALATVAAALALAVSLLRGGAGPRPG